MPDLRVIAQLLATDGVTDIVGNRVRPGVMDEDDALPACVVALAKKRPENESTGTTGSGSALVVIDCYAERYLAAHQLMSAVEAALVGHTDATGSPGISMCHETEADYETVQDIVQGDAKLLHAFSLTYHVNYYEG